MFNHISRSQLYVLDQDAALDFYVGVLGLEVATDQDLGFMRWLTVRVPGDHSRSLLLERPGPPAMDEATAAQVRELVTKGATGGWFGLATDDARKAYDTLKAEGISVRIIDLYSVKPVDAETLRIAAGETGCLVTVEDHHPEGGIGDAVSILRIDVDA